MQHFSQLFHNHLPKFAANRSYLDKLLLQGFPTLRDDEWKYTNISSLINKSWQLPLAIKKDEVTAFLTEINQVIGLDIEHYLIVIVNGSIVINQASALINQSKILNSSSNYPKNSFILLNNIFAETGFKLTIPENTVIDKPLHIVHYMTDAASEQMFNQHNFINVGSNAQVTLIETFLAQTNNLYWQNHLTDIQLNASAQLTHFSIQRESNNAFHLSNTFVTQAENSQYKRFSLALGARLSRQEIHQHLIGVNASTTCKGIYLLKGKQLSDHRIKVQHIAQETTSEVFYKGVLAESSRGVFNSKAIVAVGAQKTNAKQINKNLLLSPHADVNTKPELEIYADDVKCTHGATVGQLDENALFYLTARGIDTPSATALLIYAFAVDLLASIEQGELREYFKNLILHELPSGEEVKEMIDL